MIPRSSMVIIPSTAVSRIARRRSSVSSCKRRDSREPVVPRPGDGCCCSRARRRAINSALLKWVYLLIAENAQHYPIFSLQSNFAKTLERQKDETEKVAEQSV